MPSLQNRSNCAFRCGFPRLATITTAKSGLKAWGGKVILDDNPEQIRDFPQFKSRFEQFEIYDTESIYSYLFDQLYALN